MIDPWDKAAECDRALETCSDEGRMLVLVNLRELWIAIGNERAGGMADWGEHAEQAAEIHTTVVRPLMH
jgi:hypothetical protein